MAVTYENPAALGAPMGKYSHLSRAGDLVMVAGQVGVRPDGSLAGDDVRSQLLQVFENLRLALESVGGGFESVMKFTTYLVGEAAIAAFRHARDELYPRIYSSGAYPPNTLIVVQGLVRPEFVLEIDAMAWVPASEASPRAPEM
ncbi:MAG: RidA family protein [Candidatus Limnocylindria bacterium]